MLSEVISETYNTAEVAYALGHPNFTDFRRNLYRDKLLVLPRHMTQGRGGGEYRYGHIAEMALHMAIAAPFSREAGRDFTWGFFAQIKSDLIGARALDQHLDHLSALKNDFSAEQDKFGMSDIVLAPNIFLNEDIISRDPKNRTWALFLPMAGKGRRQILELHREIDIADDGGETTLTVQKIRNRAYNMAIRYAANDQVEQLLAERSFVPGMIDVTAVFNQIDSRLSIRLEARNPGLART